MDRRDLQERIEELHEASFAWSLVCCRGQPEAAADVLQTTYLKILEGRARYRGTGVFKTWLFAVIRKTAAGQHRRRALHRVLLEGWARREPPSPVVVDPESQASSSEEAARLRRALGGLARRQREVLELVFYHDLSIAEAAAILGLNLGTARTHYQRGKQRLLAAWEAHDD